MKVSRGFFLGDYSMLLSVEYEFKILSDEKYEMRWNMKSLEWELIKKHLSELEIGGAEWSFSLQPHPVISGRPLQDFRFYWKRREGSDRLMMAHPSLDEWVVSVSLTSTSEQAFIESMESQKKFDSKLLSQLHAFNNFTLLCEITD